MTLPASRPALLSLQFFSYPDAIGGAWKYTHEVNRRLAERGWPVQELQLERGRLDEVFRTITQQGGRS